MTFRFPDECIVPPGSTAWLVARDSGGDAQERSIPQQIEAYRAYCDHFNLIDEGIFVDEARPGDNAEYREGLLAMMERAEQWPIIWDRKKRTRKAREVNHVVVFWKSSRIGRDQVGTGYIKNFLRIRGIQLISMSDPFSTGELKFDILYEAFQELQDEMSLEIISTDAKRGLHAVVGLRDTNPEFLRWNPDWESTGRYLGVFPGRTPPRGFTVERVRIGTKRSGQPRFVQRMVPHPEQWDTARLAWRMRVMDQASYPEIERVVHLYHNANGYTHFFRNMIYIGILEFGGETYGTPDDPFVPPLIPQEWFEIEAGRRESRARRRQKGGSSDGQVIDARAYGSTYLLSGMLFCARCGGHLHGGTIPAGIVAGREDRGRHRGEWRFYFCNEAKNKRCTAGKIAARRIEGGVIDFLEERVVTAEGLRQHLTTLAAALDEQMADRMQQIAVLRASMATRRRQIDNLARAIADAGPSDALLRELRTCEEEERRINRMLQALEADLHHGSLAEFNPEIADVIAQNLRTALASEKETARRVIRDLIARIIVEPGRPLRAHIQFTFPWPQLLTYENALQTGAKHGAP